MNKVWNASEKEELWRKLSELDITPHHYSLTFEARLAREQAWSLDKSLAVVEEYRRFLFLLLTCQHPVTPSEAVDAAWHLHLLYTRNYYEELCQGIAGFIIHHQPTAGGEEERDKFRVWYQRTLDSYNESFGTPPRDIWPDVDSRFAQAGAGRWYNPTTHVLLPRISYWLKDWLKSKFSSKRKSSKDKNNKGNS